MTDQERQKTEDAVFAWIDCVPDIPQNERGVEYTAPCTCGGTIKAVRSGSNGHLRAWCESCGMVRVKETRIMDDTINALKKANKDLEDVIADLDEMLEDDDLAPEGVRWLEVLKITNTMHRFREICRDKNKPELPCVGCPIWNICGTLPGNLDDETIEKAAEAAADYLQKKEADE